MIDQETPAETTAETGPDFDRDALIETIRERLDAVPGVDDAPGARFAGEAVGPAFRNHLLADMYATLYEFRLTIDALQRGGASAIFGKMLGGGGGGGRRARRRQEKEGDAT